MKSSSAAQGGGINTQTVQIGASQNGRQIGAAGDFLESLLIIPETTSPGQVKLHDGEAAIIIFAGGENSVTDLRPISVVLGMRAKSLVWCVSTGVSLSLIATIGKTEGEHEHELA